jgi:hypothetical protein
MDKNESQQEKSGTSSENGIAAAVGRGIDRLIEITRSMFVPNKRLSSADRSGDVDLSGNFEVFYVFVLEPNCPIKVFLLGKQLPKNNTIPNAAKFALSSASAAIRGFVSFRRMPIVISTIWSFISRLSS